MKIKAWIGALRLRTLPLSLSGIIVGSALAFTFGGWDLRIFTLAISTTILFQVLSNLANDLGDAQKGTDNERRIGPERAVQSGVISQHQMKIAVIIVAILSFASALFLIHFSTPYLSELMKWTYVGLALLSIAAAILYTIGKSAYGYYGFGDIMVFFFFGLLSVFGVYFLFGLNWNLILVYPAISIGCWSTAVLNLNNMRDIENDRASAKKTLAVQLGWNGAKMYHLSLVIIGFITWFISAGIHSGKTGNWIFVISALPPILFYPHIIRIIKIKEPQQYDAELKKVALITFFSSLLFSICLFTV